MRIDVGGRSKEIVAYSHGTRFDIRRAGCVYRYAFPPMGVNYAFKPYEYGYPIFIQVEPDMSVYFITGAAMSIVNVRQIKDHQEGGFPLKPFSRTCAFRP